MWMKSKSSRYWKSLARIGPGAKAPELHWDRRPRVDIGVIYVPDPQPDSVFVITAYELAGKPLAAFRRRRKKKHQ